MRLGLLDIGSTAARLELVDLEHPRIPRSNWTFKAKTRLADNTRIDGTVTPEGIDKAARAVARATKAGATQRPHLVVAFGTAAVRDARNSAALRERLAEAAGTHIGVLSPHDEATLTYQAAHHWSGRRGAALTMVDVGGGTVDVATGFGHFPDDVISLPLGAARLTRLHLAESDPPSPERFARFVQHTREAVQESMARLASADLGYAVALSKLLRQLAVLAASSRHTLVRHPDRLTRAGVERWIPRLAELTERERAALPGISRGRARRILAGAVVTEAVLDAIGVDELEICPWGLREGLVFRFVAAYRSLAEERANREARGDAVRAAMEDMFV